MALRLAHTGALLRWRRRGQGGNTSGNGQHSRRAGCPQAAVASSRYSLAGTQLLVQDPHRPLLPHAIDRPPVNPTGHGKEHDTPSCVLRQLVASAPLGGVGVAPLQESEGR